jgi:serine/threonine-protein kinase
MELVPGIDLGVLLEREGPLDPRRTVELAAQVASALDAAHAFGLVHRDVKPSNVLVAPGDRVKVADFGIAKRLGEPSALTATGFLGSVDYAAPEQVAQGDVDARTDVYALGCLVFHCLTGRPPFARATQLDTLNAQMTAPPPRVSSAARGGLPGAVDAVLARALAKVPGRRQRSCGELVAQLAAALEPAPRREPRRLALAGAGAVAVALVLGGAALAILPSEAPERPAPPPASTSAPPPRPAGQRAEVAWSERSGRAWQAFAGAWSEGWDSGCERVFDDAGAELLEVQGSGVRMTLQECREARPASPAGGVPEAPPGDPREAGLASGARAGCEHVFTLAPQVETADGLDVVDDSMCN